MRFYLDLDFTLFSYSFHRKWMLIWKRVTRRLCLKLAVCCWLRKNFLHQTSQVFTHASAACRDSESDSCFCLFNILSSEKSEEEKKLYMGIIYKVLLYLKLTLINFTEGAHIHCLPSVHLRQHGRRGRRKATSNSGKTFGVQTQSPRAATFSKLLKLLQRQLLQLSWELLFCWGICLYCFCLKHMARLCPNRQQSF